MCSLSTVGTMTNAGMDCIIYVLNVKEMEYIHE